MLLALALTQAIAGASVLAAAPPETAEIQTSELHPADMLLFEASLDRLTLTDGLTAFGDPQKPWLPIGELARLLDLDLEVTPSEGRIEGTLGQERRTVLIDVRREIMRVDGQELPLSRADVGYTSTDIYIRADALSRILPIDFDVDAEALTIVLRPREPLPVQARADRLQRLQGLGRNREGAPPMRIETPYRLASPPAFDAILETTRDSRRTESFTRRYDVRAAGDLLYTNVQGYLGSDGTGSPATARLLLERRSAVGALPLGATRISAGDVFTPTLALGPRSIAGRGLSFSTAPLSQAGLLNTIDLRGELPIGYDVELYVNDVLYSGQRTPVEGQYEFLAVPLMRGINVIRIVTYGPRGERSEIVRVVNAGGGLLPKGETTIDFGLVQQRALFQLRDLPGADSGIGARDEPRLVMSIAHGVSETFSLIGGASLYSSRQGDERQLVSGGVRASLAGYAVQLDAAGDQTGGRALAAGASGELLGSSVSVRHAEYRGGFIDETSLLGSPDRLLARNTTAMANARLALAGLSLPLSMRVMRDGFTDGGTSWIGTARTSTSVMRTLVSTGVDYVRESRPGQRTYDRMTGNFDLSRLVNYTWQLRASAVYDVVPVVRMRSALATIDRSIGDRMAMRLGMGHSFGRPKDTTVQGGLVLRMPFGEFALSGDYATSSGEWRTGLRIAIGSLFDPMRGRYVVTPPGPATSASAAFHAFLDNDGDGRYGPDDEAVPQIMVAGGRHEALTSEGGRVLVTGLGGGSVARLHVDTGNVDKLYLVTPPPTIEFASRPGQVLSIPYVMTPAGEVFGRIVLRKDGQETGLSAVRMRLAREGMPPLTAVTEFDGTVIFSNVPPGTYRLELDPEQAAKLGMRLREALTLEVQADGFSDLTADILFDRDST